MDYSFARYLLSKQSVDDRALNKDVLDSLRLHMPPGPVSVIEIGAGIGTMLKRMVDWEFFGRGSYILVDSMQENIDYARDWIPQWAAEAGLSVARNGKNELHLCDHTREIRIQLACADVFDFVRVCPRPADLLIAHAFLDLLPMPECLQKIFPLTHHLAWLTINFDGVSSMQPAIDYPLDERIEKLYHATMDSRPTGGASRIGRNLFEHIRTVQAEIIAAGASDWVVYAKDGKYPADEKYFLQFILDFYESSLKDCEELNPEVFKSWLTRRRQQIECGEMVYIAHQMDFLIRQRSWPSSP